MKIKETKIKSINIVDNEDVYDIEVKDNHNFFANNLLVHNCAELVLCDGDSCRLLLLNLFSYVKNPFKKNASFDFDLFKKHSIIAQRYMDDIVDLELEKIDKILEKIHNDPETDETKAIEINLWKRIRSKCEIGRRCGTGVTGEGDMLAALGYRYGTKEATNFVINVHQQLAINVYKSSTILAKERGPFNIFNMDLEKNNPFVNRLYELDSELYEMVKLHGRRNIGLLTCSPAGSVSILTQTSSGVEPVFSIYYKRRTKINTEKENKKVDFVDDLGDQWSEYNVFHHKFLEWAKINNYNIDENTPSDEIDKIIEKSPYYKATSSDLDWKESVSMLGGMSKFVDHSISKTINLPANTTIEQVDELYKFAYKVGCKGVTIYRDGSRSGVLISGKKENNQQPSIEETNAPKRPKVLKCDILRFQNNKEKWIGFVGLMDNKPYEIFTGLLDSFQVPTFVENGWIKKVKEIKKDEEGKDIKASRYDFLYTDKDGYEQEMRGLSRAFDREYWNYGKLMSGILRHGMPLPNVMSLIDSLNLKGDSIVSWKAGVKRMLKPYLKDGEILSGQVCPDCGAEIKFESGCQSCSVNCGWSKCG